MTTGITQSAGASTLCAIVFYGRVGSTLLVRTLNSHPLVLGLGEMFHPNGTSLHLTGSDYNVIATILAKDPELRGLRLAKPKAFLELLRIKIRKYLPEKHIVVFKVSFAQEEATGTGLLLDTECKKILLNRDNVLAMFASFEVARTSNIWHVSSLREESVDGIQFMDDVRPGQQTPIQFDSTAFDAFLAKVQKEYAAVRMEMRRSAQPYLEIRYEDLRRKDTLSRVAEFLKLPGELDPEMTGLVKLGKKRPLDNFANPDAVLKHMRRIGKSEWCETL